MFTTTVTFEGNIATDVDLAYTTNTNTPVVEFVVLVNRRIQNEAGEWTASTPTRHRVKAFKTLAEGAAQLGKGQRVLIHGYVETDEWPDKEAGERRTSDRVIAQAIGHSIRFNRTEADDQ